VREERILSSLALAPQTGLVIEAHGADVKLVTSPDDSVRVVTWKRVQGFSQRSVDALWSELRVTMERSGQALMLRVYTPRRGTEQVTVNFGPYRYRHAVEMLLTVSVPAGRDVTVHTDNGDVTAFALKSDLTLGTRSGDVHLVEQAGGATLETVSGDVKLVSVTGVVRLHTRSGDVVADSLLAGADIHTASGDVSVTRSLGPFGIETGSGEVHLKTSRGDASLRTSSGDIEYFASSDTLLTESTSGDQTLDLATAPRRVASQSTSGDIELALPASSGGQLDVETSSGAIAVTSPLKVDSASRKHLAGSLGGPGSTWVHTSSGDIKVSSAHDATAAASGGDAQ
jgi:DUF4097 and DUF4098 domain-containing protein YvlB